MRARSVVLVSCIAVFAAACGDDAAPTANGDTTAPVTTPATPAVTDYSAACEQLADNRFGGDADVLASAFASNRVYCTLEFRADAASLSDIGLTVNPACPAEASILVPFAQDSAGEFQLDERGMATVDNGSCLVERP